MSASSDQLDGRVRVPHRDQPTRAIFILPAAARDDIAEYFRRPQRDFTKWYETWQARLAADDLMVWIKQARNRIEKEGDLKTQRCAHKPVGRMA